MCSNMNLVWYMKSLIVVFSSLVKYFVTYEYSRILWYFRVSSSCPKFWFESRLRIYRLQFHSKDGFYNHISIIMTPKWIIAIRSCLTHVSCNLLKVKATTSIFLLLSVSSRADVNSQSWCRSYSFCWARLERDGGFGSPIHLASSLPTSTSNLAISIN